MDNINVLSLFDGISCCRVALDRAKINVNNYFSSEIDKFALQVANENWPQDIKNRLGDVKKINGYNLPKINLLAGGSPCNNFSFAGKRNGMSTKDNIEILSLEHYLELKQEEVEFDGQSYLFWEYVRLWYETRPDYFLLENVKMQKKWQDLISKIFEVEPILINSALVSAQNRNRLYWTNIPDVQQPKDKNIFVKSILDDGYHCLVSNQKTEFHPSNGKAACILARDSHGFGNQKMNAVFGKYHEIENGSIMLYKLPHGYITEDYYYANKYPSLCAQSPATKHKVFDEKDMYFRKLSPEECEKLQTLDVGYTNNLSNSQRYKCIGNGWTVDVIAHIFSFLKKNEPKHTK